MCAVWLQVFDEYDDEVAEAEAAEGAGSQQREDRDQDLKPFTSHRARWAGVGREGTVDGAEGAGAGVATAQANTLASCRRAVEAAMGQGDATCRA